jgi:integrase/recombinase XerC
MDLIAEYAAYLADLHRSPRTIEEYVGCLRRLDRDLPNGLAGANEPELKAGIFTERRGAAARLLYRAAVTGFFTWATCPPDDPDEPWLDFDPSARLPCPPRPRRRPKPLSSDQLAAILGRAGEPYRTWFLLAGYAGLRCVEISRLRREHVTQEEVWVREGKGGRERYVPTHPVLWRTLAELPPGPVALDYDGKTVLDAIKVSHRGNRRLRPLVPGASMHRLRHWFGTEAYRATRDPFAVRDLMGHADVATTQVYVEIVDGQREAAVAALPDLT